jgi:hypothetical protein
MLSPDYDDGVEHSRFASNDTRLSIPCGWVYVASQWHCACEAFLIVRELLILLVYIFLNRI